MSPVSKTESTFGQVQGQEVRREISRLTGRPTLPLRTVLLSFIRPSDDIQVQPFCTPIQSYSHPDIAQHSFIQKFFIKKENPQPEF